MGKLASMPAEELKSLRTELEGRYDSFKAANLNLDMTRGKPSSEQLDLAAGLLSLPGEGSFRDAGGLDCRNYGNLDGIPSAKALFAAYTGLPAERLILGGNSSLTLMHDTVVRALLHGVPGGKGPWRDQDTAFLCPVPGYDRHFAICEHHGIRMIPVPYNDDGPDMDEVEKLVATDDTIKGIWIVPRYSNPTGITCSDAVVDRLAAMATAAADFRIFWDDAYAVHHLGDGPAPLKNLAIACDQAGNPDRALIFGSTSKISFAGSGIGFMGASPANIADSKAHLGKQTIGPDKLNALRHVAFFRDYDGLLAHMDRHAAILRPKFDAVLDIFAKELDGLGIATWSKPTGGYFINLDTSDGLASETVRLCGEAGVRLTSAGATYPYGKDPRDCNIRIAPSLPPLDEIRTAMEVVTVCLKRAAVAKLL